MHSRGRSVDSDARIVREQLLTFTGNADGFKAFYASIVRPILRRCRAELCYDTSLCEADMRARQLLIAQLEDGITDALKRAKVEVPDWLALEIQHERNE